MDFQRFALDEPVQPSRNWDDGDNDDIFNNSYENDLSRLSYQSVVGDSTAPFIKENGLLIVGLKGSGASCLRAAFQNAHRVGKLSYAPERDDSAWAMVMGYANRSIVAVADVLQVSENCFIVLFEEDVPLKQANHWASTILEVFFSSENLKLPSAQPELVILDSLPIQELQGKERPLPPGLRWLGTASYQPKCVGTNICPLSPPNLIDGMAASLLTKMHIRQKSAVLFLSLQDSLCPTGDSLMAFDGVLRSIVNLENEIDYSKQAKSLQHSGVHNPLYL